LTQALSTKGGWSCRFVKRDSHGQSGMVCQRQFKNERIDSSADRDAAAGVELQKIGAQSHQDACKSVLSGKPCGCKLKSPSAKKPKHVFQ
jgi:hypothetical protein